MPANPQMHGAASAAAVELETPASGRRVAGQDPQKRRQILAGAKRCFMRMGFEAASMNDITAEAGVSKGTIYVYFADKEDLFGNLCEEERTRHLLFAQSELETSVDTEDGLRRFGIAITTRLTSEEVMRAMRMVIGVAERLPHLARRFFGNEPFSGLSVLRSFIDRKVAEGDLVIEDTELAARQFIDLAMANVFKRRLFGNLQDEVDPEEIRRLVDSAVAMFLSFYGRRK